ncbi:MAG: four-helix bundle copper-binding protein [Nibricoccus sp.]
MHETYSHLDSHGHDLSKCIEACSECHAMCEHMVYQHCLSMGGKHVGQEHLRLMADCAQICRTSADFMLRGSPRHMLTCRICAEICEACAEECERIGEMDDCVEACRECAEACREMAGSHV